MKIIISGELFKLLNYWCAIGNQQREQTSAGYQSIEDQFQVEVNDLDNYVFTSEKRIRNQVIWLIKLSH